MKFKNSYWIISISSRLILRLFISKNKLNEENSNLYNAIKEWINKNKLISCTSDLPKEYNDLLLKTKKELYDEYLKYWDLKEVSYFAW